MDDESKDRPPASLLSGGGFGEGENAAVGDLIEVQRAVGTVGRDGVNPAFKKTGKSYVRLETLLEAVLPPLHERGFLLLQPSRQVRGGVQQETRLIHRSGAWVASVLTLPAPKSDPQGYGSAITYARRYNLCSLLAVPTGDDDKPGAPPPPADRDDDGNAATAAVRADRDAEPAADEPAAEELAKSVYNAVQAGAKANGKPLSAPLLAAALADLNGGEVIEWGDVKADAALAARLRSAVGAKFKADGRGDKEAWAAGWVAGLLAELDLDAAADSQMGPAAGAPAEQPAEQFTHVLDDPLARPFPAGDVGPAARAWYAGAVALLLNRAKARGDAERDAILKWTWRKPGTAKLTMAKLSAGDYTPSDLRGQWESMAWVAREGGTPPEEWGTDAGALGDAGHEAGGER